MIAVLVTLVVLTIVPALVLALLGGRIFPQERRVVRAAHARTETASPVGKTMSPVGKTMSPVGRRSSRATKEHTTLV